MPDPLSISDVRQWEIWQVRWDHDDGSSKDRPAISISTTTEVAAQGFARFLKITKEDHPEVPCCLKISSTEPQFRHTGLDVTRWIHCLDDQTVDAGGLRYRRGHVNALTAAYISARLTNWAGEG
jgi:hypothetical protein